MSRSKNDKVADRTLPEYFDPVLEEYKEVTTFMRHDDQVAWTILGLCATLATGIWAYTFKDLDLCSWRSVMLAGFGVLILSLGRLFARRITAITRLRRKRGVELEERLGFRLLTSLDDESPKKKNAIGINRLLDMTIATAWLGWTLYLLVRLSNLGCVSSQ